MKPNTTYSFCVVAVYQPKAGGASVLTVNPVTVKTKTAVFVAPKLVKSATGDITTTSITLRWQAYSSADDFLVTCSQIALNFNIGGNASYLKDGTGNIIGVTITGLQPARKYDFVIAAMNSTLNATSAILKKSVTTLKS